MRTTIVPQALTADELAYKQTIYANPAESKSINENIITNIIAATNVDFLLNLAIKDRDIDAVCKQVQFELHWRNVWRQLGLNPAEFARSNGDVLHENLPLITVPVLDLLKGDLIYQKYRLLADGGEMKVENYLQAKAYLEEAADYGCYFALNALCTNGLQQLKQMPSAAERQELAEKILIYANKAADLHWTPGYLLLANVLQELSLYYMDNYPNAPDSMGKKVFFTGAACALHVAQKLEEHSYCSINNAYQGKTIGQATNGIYSSWFNAKMRLQRMSGGLLKIQDLDDASRKAATIVRDLDKKYDFAALKKLQNFNGVNAIDADIDSTPENGDRKSSMRL
jgi:hypothetical protein